MSHDNPAVDLSVIERHESSVRSYVRAFPTVFARSAGPRMFDRAGRAYIDFFAGAGALNYGHNPQPMQQALIDYIAEQGIGHALDMATEAKIAFIEAFQRIVLAPRGLDYRLMFTGPTGTNAVEAALKLARKTTGRSSVVAFTNGFHGMTLGALAATGSRGVRGGAGVALHDIVRMPFDGYFGPGVDTLAQIERLLGDPSSGIGPPAAFLLETVQAEGGVNVASADWLRGVAALARRHGALVIVDDIQVGCGRTGRFFSFEEANITPDIVCLSKSLSGSGLPMALNLIRPEIDDWRPGEHNGTFRGNNLAFVTARVALETHWADDALSRRVAASAKRVCARLGAIAEAHGATVRGRGLIQGLVFETQPERSRAVARRAFEAGLIIETAGARDQVLKLLPPLTIDDGTLDAGLDIIAAALDAG